MDATFYDALEARDPAAREAALMAALPQVIAAAKQHAPAYRDRLAKVRSEDITDRRALVDLQLTRKSELLELQLSRCPILFRGIACLTARDHIPLSAPPAPCERHNMIHGQFTGRK